MTCHGLRNFSPAHTHPLISIREFSKPYELLFSELESLIKCWMWIGKKIHSIIWCVTCYGLRNFAPTHTHPLKTCHEFSKPYELLFSELEWLIKLYRNSLSNFMCDLSWLEKIFPTHTYPLISIHEILKPYNLIIFWVRVTHKMLNVNWEKIHSILCVTFHGVRNFDPTHTHPLKTSHEFLKPYEIIFWVSHS